MRWAWHVLLLSGSALPVAAQSAEARPKVAQPTAIRLVPDLAVIYAEQAVKGGDREVVFRFGAASPDGTRWKNADLLPAGATVEEGRTGSSFDRAEDLRSARHIVMCFHTARGEATFPGATQRAVSRAIFDELRTKGESPIVLVDASAAEGGCQSGGDGGFKNFRGTIKRIDNENMRVLVDGVPAMLRTLHAKGTVTAREESGDVEFWWLDDADNRLLLGYRFGTTAYRVVRIDHPVPDAAAANAVAAALAGKTCRAELNGILFRSGSAQLLSTSRTAIGAIATALQSHPDWRVTIEGHTDNVGGDAINRDLSARRAEAVKAELTARHGMDASRIKTQGFGSLRPIDKNETLDGRAHNRRVEIARVC